MGLAFEKFSALSSSEREALLHQIRKSGIHCETRTSCKASEIFDRFLILKNLRKTEIIFETDQDGKSESSSLWPLGWIDTIVKYYILVSCTTRVMTSASSTMNPVHGSSFKRQQFFIPSVSSKHSCLGSAKNAVQASALAQTARFSSCCGVKLRSWAQLAEEWLRWPDRSHGWVCW